MRALLFVCFASSIAVLTLNRRVSHHRVHIGSDAVDQVNKHICLQHADVTTCACSCRAHDCTHSACQQSGAFSPLVRAVLRRTK